mmetsp:Transcript_30468/g.26987  ORF Transcript_30468/g.26987 Transcript_30468/m.26987 type:complete len:244 (-) Transcript_30468:59-790(-)
MSKNNDFMLAQLHPPIQGRNLKIATRNTIGRSSTVFNNTDEKNLAKDNFGLKFKDMTPKQNEKKAPGIRQINSVENNSKDELHNETSELLLFKNEDISLLKEDEILQIEPDDTSVDTEQIKDYENLTMKEESYRKAKNQNLISHKEIKELTIFFIKQSTKEIQKRLNGMRDHVNKLEYYGFIHDLKTLDQLNKYVRTKIRNDEPLKNTRRKTILKSIILISQKMALNRKLSVNQSYSQSLGWD